MPETTTDPKPTKKNGAPLKNAPGRVPYHEVDRLLVFGELVDGPEGEPPFVVYPSFRAIARRYGVNHSVIAGYAKRRDCLKRREQAQQRVTARVDDKLVEQRATEVAVGKGDAVRVIDTFIKGFEAALEEGRVRMDNPADFNTMLRLKEFLLGGPDARQEVHASLSLEELQRRHARMMSVAGDVNADAMDARCGSHALLRQNPRPRGPLYLPRRAPSHNPTRMIPEENMLNSVPMMSAERIYSEIRKLNEEERLKLDRMLEAANDEPDPAVEEAWMKETLRRRAEWKAGKVKAIPVEEALERMFAKP